jgi:hypothetical protein
VSASRHTVWLGGGVALAALGLWLWHAAGYFFLFDDYALLAQATRTPLGEVVGTPLFGFYRPFVFLATRVEGALFGWTLPAGYLIVAAGGLFLLSAWSAEAVFWMSGAFDVWATFGVLAALTAGARTCLRGTTAPWPLARGLAVVALAAAVAMTSKESAVTLIVLLPLVLASAAAPVDWRRAAALTAGVLVVAATYMTLRSRALSVLGGVYGDWWTLVRQAPVGRHLLAYARAVAMPPVTHDAAWHVTGIARLTGPLAMLALVGVFVAAATRARRALPLLLALGCALLPVIWAGMMPLNSATGRVLYLPGVCLALIAGLGVLALAAHPQAWRRTAALALCAGIAAHQLVSLNAQRAGWRHAIGLARTSIEQFRPHVGRAGHIHLTNLPYWFEEGPFVLKSYAFKLYFHPQPVPEVSATAVTLAIVDGRPRAIARAPEGGIAGQPSGEGQPVAFDLDVD